MEAADGTSSSTSLPPELAFDFCDLPLINVKWSRHLELSFYLPVVLTNGAIHGCGWHVHLNPPERTEGGAGDIARPPEWSPVFGHCPLWR
jgi:hypothetical protein